MYAVMILIVRFSVITQITAGPSGRAVLGVGIRSLAYYDRGIESDRGRGCWLCVLCVVKYRSLQRAGHSSRGVLQTVVRRCV
jgi:hypothetical protein